MYMHVLKALLNTFILLKEPFCIMCLPLWIGGRERLPMANTVVAVFSFPGWREPSVQQHRCNALRAGGRRNQWTAVQLEVVGPRALQKC